MNWKKVFESEPFDTAPLYQFSKEELNDALSELVELAPLGKYGDGMDMFWRDLDPYDAPTHSSYRLSTIYQIIRDRLGHQAFGLPSLESAHDLAMVHFQSYSIEVDEALDQYFYPDIAGEYLGGGWSWLNQDIGKRLQEKSIEIQISCPLEDWEAWTALYPWRKCCKLSYLSRNDFIPINSLDWHAANILRWEKVISDLSHPTFTKDDAALSALIHAAVQIGASYKAYLLKSESEIDALRGKGTINSARKGGESRREHYRPDTALRLQTMRKYLKIGHSVSRAAELTATRSGLGTTESNRKLWNRYK
ncbi:MAG: hypothetical protein KJ731_11935 [Alphaproteobacteria bacterium]|nr:hypothetical protein [Alphaproteobacteria bacterium]MBU1281153.1 hypothetical protein [Alphaproteobacteria bacterium]MBU1575310.1 hypothetical protein [Alphaproteobacteria bacterium]MBU1829164.1 hypothetical protein [Alphaproteobacteria bacterium]MBU2079777.1 hypothetical protein [Alphaproteobacteria bacterium]